MSAPHRARARICEQVRLHLVIAERYPGVACMNHEQRSSIQDGLDFNLRDRFSARLATCLPTYLGVHIRAACSNLRDSLDTP